MNSQKTKKKVMRCLLILIAFLLVVIAFILLRHQRTSAKRLPDQYHAQIPQFHSSVDKDGDGRD